MSYANRTLRRDFTDLGEDVFVEIRNPKVVASDRLSSDTTDPLIASCEIAAKLVKNWRVFDATSDDDEQPELPLPATPEDVAKLPVMIRTWIAEQINEAVTPR